MDRKNDRIDRDAAGVGPYAREREALVPLSESNWDVSRGNVDVRGWDVRTIGGRQLGTVRDLLIDKDAGEVVMLDVDVPGENRNAYVPIRAVQIDRETRVIHMDSADFPAAERPETKAEVAHERELADRAPRARALPTEETVVERRPVVEETVVRRYEADAPDARARDMIEPEDVGSERRGTDRRRIDRLGTDL